MTDNDTNDGEPGDGTDSATDAGAPAAGGQGETGGQGAAGGQGGAGGATTAGQSTTGGQGGASGRGAAGGQAAGGQATGARAGQGSTGSDLEPNVAGALCYALAWLSGLFFFFTEDGDDFVRFHAAQSIVAFGALTAIYVVLNQFLAAMLWSPGGIGFLLRLIGYVNTIVGLVGLGLWLGMMYLAYEGRRFELPIAGDVANNLISETDVTVERRSAGD